MLDETTVVGLATASGLMACSRTTLAETPNESERCDSRTQRGMLTIDPVALLKWKHLCLEFGKETLLTGPEPVRKIGWPTAKKQPYLCKTWTKENITADEDPFLIKS